MLNNLWTANREAILSLHFLDFLDWISQISSISSKSTTSHPHRVWTLARTRCVHLSSSSPPTCPCYPTTLTSPCRRHTNNRVRWCHQSNRANNSNSKAVWVSPGFSQPHQRIWQPWGEQLQPQLQGMHMIFMTYLKWILVAILLLWAEASKEHASFTLYYFFLFQTILFLF